MAHGKKHLTQSEKLYLGKFLDDKLEKVTDWDEDTEVGFRVSRYIDGWNDSMVAATLVKRIPNITATNVAGYRKAIWGKHPVTVKPPKAAPATEPSQQYTDLLNRVADLEKKVGVMWETLMDSPTLS